jgi:hypothetical protein
MYSIALFCHKAKALAQAQPFEVHLHPHINVERFDAIKTHTKRIDRQCVQRQDFNLSPMWMFQQALTN